MRHSAFLSLQISLDITLKSKGAKSLFKLLTKNKPECGNFVIDESGIKNSRNIVGKVIKSSYSVRPGRNLIYPVSYLNVWVVVKR